MEEGAEGQSQRGNQTAWEMEKRPQAKERRQPWETRGGQRRAFPTASNKNRTPQHPDCSPARPTRGPDLQNRQITRMCCLEPRGRLLQQLPETHTDAEAAPEAHLDFIWPLEVTGRSVPGQAYRPPCTKWEVRRQGPAIDLGGPTPCGGAGHPVPRQLGQARPGLQGSRPCQRRGEPGAPESTWARGMSL